MGKCPGCGAQLAKGARFCSLCGTAIANSTLTSQPNPPSQTMMPSRPTSSPTAGYTPPVASTNGRSGKTLWITGGAISLALVLFLLLKASGVLGAKSTETPTAAVLSAPQTRVVDAPVLNAPPVKAPEAPVLTAPAMKGNPMPEDVIAYLRWLKRFEAARRSLTSRGAAQLLLTYANMVKGPLEDLMKEPDQQSNEVKINTNKSETEVSSIIQEWNKATGLFQSYPPPNPCAALATSYNSMLVTVVQQQLKLLNIMTDTLGKASESGGKPTTDITQVLTQLMDENNNKHMSRAADNTLTTANGALDAVRNQYTDIPEDIDRNHFDIKEESSVNIPSVGLPAVPGLGI